MKKENINTEFSLAWIFEQIDKVSRSQIDKLLKITGKYNEFDPVK